MKGKLIYSFVVKFFLGLGLVGLFTALGFMGAFPGLTATALPLLIFFLLPMAVLSVILIIQGKEFNQLHHQHHLSVNSWQPTAPPGHRLTQEDELAWLKALLSNLKSEEHVLEDEIELIMVGGEQEQVPPEAVLAARR